LPSGLTEKSHCFSICETVFEFFVRGTRIETLIVTPKVG
jgi:hypothetical protein